jgi:hypothetical protein
MIAHIEIVDNGRFITAYVDAPNGRALAVLQRPRMYTKGPYVITNVRTQATCERFNAGFAMAALKRVALAEANLTNS